MRHKNIGQFEEGVRVFCRKCMAAKKLTKNRCVDRACSWFDDMEALRLRSNVLTLFTPDAFYCNAIYILTRDRNNLLDNLWWSEIREHIQKGMNAERIALPSRSQLNWWGRLSTMVRAIGWKKTDVTRYSPINRAQEFLYVKTQ